MGTKTHADVLACLARLAPHVESADLAITGSVAIGGRMANDLDLVAARPDAVRASVSADFLIIHRHHGDRLILQLADPRSGVRVDVFLDRFAGVGGARVGVHGWRVVDAAVVFAHKVEMLAGASQARPIDPKHVGDALMLAGLLGREVPAIDPRSVRAEVYSTELDARCARCEAAADPLFPLARKAEVLAVLGYV